MMRVGLAYSRIHRDEKRLLAALEDRGHEVTRIDVRDHRFGLSETTAPISDQDVVLDRCVAASRSRYLGRFCEAAGVPVVNSPGTVATCADKVRTSLALSAAGVSTPATEVAFTPESALAAVESFGYPCVLKPVVGSWGRLMAKVESRSAAEALVEHKDTLGHYEHGVFYVQEYVDKPGRDVRVLAAGGEPVAAMARSSDHWLTNAAKGAETEPFAVDGTVRELVARASEAVGGGLLGVDLMETGVEKSDDTGGDSTGADGTGGDGPGYTVHEVNHAVEFTALAETVDVDVADAVVAWLDEYVAAVDESRVEVTTG